MRRVAATILAFIALGLTTSCSTVNNQFVVENGLCYRVRTTKTLGMQTRKEKVLAVPENCGLAPSKTYRP